MKFNKNLHLAIWILYILSLVLYKKFEMQNALFAADAFMACITFQIIRWCLCIPKNKDKNYKNNTSINS